MRSKVNRNLKLVGSYTNSECCLGIYKLYLELCILPRTHSLEILTIELGVATV